MRVSYLPSLPGNLRARRTPPRASRRTTSIPKSATTLPRGATTVRDERPEGSSPCAHDRARRPYRTPATYQRAWSKRMTTNLRVKRLKVLPKRKAIREQLRMITL